MTVWVVVSWNECDEDWIDGVFQDRSDAERHMLVLIKECLETEMEEEGTDDVDTFGTWSESVKSLGFTHHNGGWGNFMRQFDVQ